jgi:hypothetical protein
MLVSYDGIKIRSSLYEKAKKYIFCCPDSNPEISKPYKFVLQQILVSYDGIYIYHIKPMRKGQKKNNYFLCQDSNLKNLKAI